MTGSVPEVAARPPGIRGKSQTRLGELLRRQGRLRQAQLKKALELQTAVGGRLGTNLLELDFVAERALLAALGEQRATRTVSGSDLQNAHPAVVRMIRAKLAERYRIVPFYLKGKTLFIASTDPVDALIEDEIRILSGCMVRSFIALEVRIFEALEMYYRVPIELRYATLSRRLGASAQRLESRRPEGRASGLTAAKGGHQAGEERPAEDQPAAPEATPPAASPGVKPEPPSFIELDADDEALLRSATGAPAAGAPAAGAPAAGTPAAGMPEAREEINTQEILPSETPVVRPTSADLPEVSPAQRRGSEPSAEERLDRAARELQRAVIRDDIADVLLDFCAPYFKRRLLLFRRKDRIIGWRGEGSGVEPETVRAVEIGAGEPSVFLSVSESGFWLGPLPRLAPNESLVQGLGGQRPRDCVVLPITLLSKIVCYLYGDNLDESVAGAPVAELRRLAGKAAIAFEVYILKNKIRML